MKKKSLAFLAAAIATASVLGAALSADAATSSYGQISCGSSYVRVFGYASGATTVHTSDNNGSGAFATYHPGAVLTYHSYKSSFLHTATFTGISTSPDGHIQKGGDGKACQA